MHGLWKLFLGKELFSEDEICQNIVTTSKPEIPEKAKQEAKLVYQGKILRCFEEYSIPPSLILNFDQTPLKYAPIANRTLLAKESKHVAIIDTHIFL